MFLCAHILYERITLSVCMYCVTCALSSSYSRYPIPSSLCRSIQPLQITHTPFKIIGAFKWTWGGRKRKREREINASISLYCVFSTVTGLKLSISSVFWYFIKCVSTDICSVMFLSWKCLKPSAGKISEVLCFSKAEVLN